MPHSYSGQVVQADGVWRITHTTFVNEPDGERPYYRASQTVAADASHEEIAKGFGEAARLSLLAALEAHEHSKASNRSGD